MSDTQVAKSGGNESEAPQSIEAAALKRLQIALQIHHAQHSTTGWATVAKGRCPEEDRLCEAGRDVLVGAAHAQERADALAVEGLRQGGRGMISNQELLRR